MNVTKTAKEVLSVKKKLITCLFACIAVFLFSVPVMATEVAVVEPANAEAKQEITPFNEMTQIFFRTYGGVLQFRVWSITNGRWITDWIPMIPA